MTTREIAKRAAKKTGSRRAQKARNARANTTQAVIAETDAAKRERAIAAEKTGTTRSQTTQAVIAETDAAKRERAIAAGKTGTTRSQTAPAVIAETTGAAENRPWIGMDVDKVNFAAALYVDPRPGAPDRAAMPTATFSRDAKGVAACAEWAEKTLAQKRPGSPAPRVCMEATGAYSVGLTREILRLRPEWEPAIANARFVKKHGEGMGQRCKSDKADARVCACYGAERQPSPYCAPSPAFRELRELARERRATVEQRAALKNRAANAAVSKTVLQTQKQLMRHYDRTVEKLDGAIARTVKEIPELAADARAVVQIPGVAETVSSVTLSELGDLRQYRHGRSIAAAVGVNPRVVESGTHKGKTRMSKQGNAHVRAVLYCAAMACLKTKKDHCLKRFYNRLIARGKTHMQALGALMRKIVVLMRALVISGEPFDPDYDLKKSGCAAAGE